MQKNHLDSTQPPKKSQNLSGRVSDKFTSNFCFLETQKRYARINVWHCQYSYFYRMFHGPLPFSVFHGHHQGQRDCSYLRADMDGWLPLPSESHCHTTVEYCRAPIPATIVLLPSYTIAMWYATPYYTDQQHYMLSDHTCAIPYQTIPY